MSWVAAKAALGERLEGLAITAPIAQTVRRVYVDPPRSIEPGDLPAIVFGESSLEDIWSSNQATEEYLLTGYVALRDENDAIAVQLSEAYRDALKAKFRSNLYLLAPPDATVTALLSEGPSFSELGRVQIGGQRYAGFAFQLPITITGTVTFADSDYEEPEP